MPLLDSIMSAVTPQVLSSISGKMGESPDAVQKGIQGGIAAVLGTMAGKIGDHSFMQQILAMITSKANDPNIFGEIAGLAHGNVPQAVKDLGAQVLSLVFGSAGQQSSVANLVGQSAGLKSSSASTILGMAGPLVLGALSKQGGSGLSVSSLSSMLSSELPSLTKFMPAGLSSVVGNISAPAPHISTPKMVVPEESSSGTSWLIPALIGLLALGGLIYWLTQGKEPVKEAATKTMETAQTATTAVADTAKGMWAALGEFFKRKLPNGVELNIPKMGVENRLIDYIEDASKPVDKEAWFDFDRLLFDTGKSTLKSESQAQLEDVANIMKAYPKVKIRIGGYTDNVGDKAMNLKLSEDRATNVMAELVKLGVDKTRMDAKGYGEEHPVGDNTTEEGRAKNRRISMRLTEK